MKNYISTLMLICFAYFSNAQNDFDSQWKAVTKFESQGLTKSAADLAKEIYKSAISKKDKQQRIKALLYKSKYMLTLEEEAQLNIVNLFKAEIKTSDTVTKHLLENLLATMYWRYFQQNRYKFYNRTKTDSKVDEVDFRTWDLETLFNEIHVYYQRSLENDILLQQEPLTNYKTLIVEVEKSKNFRPTLFDLLSHNALEFYKTDENSITQPAYKFSIDNDSFIADSERFINLNLTAKDSSSLQLNALKIYQNLLKFHCKDKASKAFVAIDIERLNFVFLNTTFENKDALLLKTVKKKAEILKSSPLSALYNFEIASLYKNQSTNYNSNPNEGDIDETHRWKLKEALELCNNVIANFPKSEGAIKCEILKEQVLQTSIRFQAEQFISLKAPTRVLVSYKNLKALDLRIYKVSQKQLENYNSIYNVKDKTNFFKKLSANESFSSALKSESDYQNHSTELVLPKLSNGLYLLKSDTNTEANVFGTTHIQVTNLALIESTENNTHNYQLVNRNNGQPIVDAKVELSYTKNGRQKSWTKKFVTDRYGGFQFTKDNNRYRNIEIKATYKDDTGYFGDYYITKKYKENTNNDTQYRSFLFTDRSIYRPGQTAFFKGIATKSKDGKTEVFENNAAKLRLKNVNGEVVSELLLKTNKFGSVHGEFILPNDGLTGNYTIDMFCGNYGYAYISVEEYKRPKFKPEFQPIKETFKVNDSITVNGIAAAFAGSNITDAKVIYRVIRQVQYPIWYYWRRPYFNVEPQEITFGESKTNSKGEFEITFKAIPDESVSKDNLPVFRYEVIADITDINGETRTATTAVNVGYHAMTVRIVAPKVIDKSKQEVEVSLESQNLNGEFISAKGTLKIYKLNAPNTVLRPRRWGAPDYQVLSKEEFKALFPHDPYDNEDILTNWKKGDEVFKTYFDTEKEKTITLKELKKWNSGKYIIILESQDKFGQTLKDEAYTSLFSANDKNVADSQLFEGQLDKASYTPGSLAKLTIGSAAEDITVTIEIEKDHEVILTQLVTLSNSKETILIPVIESDLGGFEVHCSFAAFNDYTSRTFRVNVPYPKTDLEIETATFRDKLQPGHHETWSFKIKGPKGDKVSAELLASMYDASLDEFRGHAWSFSPINRPTYYGRVNKNFRHSFGNTNFRLFNNSNTSTSYPHQGYDRLNWFGFYFGQGFTVFNSNEKSRSRMLNAPEAAMMVEDSAELEEVAFIKTTSQPDNTSEIRIRGNGSMSGNKSPLYIIDGEIFTGDFSTIDVSTIIDTKILKGSEAIALYGDKGKNGVILITTSLVKHEMQKVKVRKNLHETAFFFPQLQTDVEGNISFNFKAPEALTKWKLQLLAHTKTLESAVTQLETVTQKELMVIPNSPRFLREGDKITISTKIANLTDKKLSGVARLELSDFVTGRTLFTLIEGEEGSNSTLTSELTDKKFTVDAKGNTQASWSLRISEGLQAVQYKIMALTEDFSDGEQNALPVLSNRMLVTETLPMWVRSNQSKKFTLDKLKNNTSTTLSNHKLTLEMTSNPAWYAVQALPYLMEYPYDCNEQTFSRYYANALAQHIVQSNPKIEAVFNQWKSTDALLSNLEKNQELKSILIQETPWLRDAQSKTEQKKRIGLLFELNKMTNELNSAKRKLQQGQMSSGAWAWFNGGRENRYITQHIISGFGHLKQLSVIKSDSEEPMIKNALNYLDAQFVKEYKDLKKYNENIDLSKDHLSYTQLHYLYVRSFYPEVKVSKEVKTIMDYYLSQIQKYWLTRSLYAKGLMALAMHRMDDAKTAIKILKSLKENSISSDEHGMYWKANANSWNWYQAPIETQALLIEAFSEIENNITIIDNLKIWLLKNKQTNQWKTTKATTDAVYALLLQGSDWLDVTEMVDVKVGNEAISPETLENVKLEASTGYYKTSWTDSEIKPEQANITITKKGDGIAWGGLYWQYFENLDKITSAETPLKLSKKLFLKTNTAHGEEISEINSATKLKVGDLVRVRIELRTDRSMEFVHLKDMRAAGFEPVNVISQYKYQDGLGYYESTKDAATNFFIDYLPKGICIFEYDLRINNAGDMSNGISTIQSMYAPEFSSHSEGVRIMVE